MAENENPQKRAPEKFPGQAPRDPNQQQEKREQRGTDFVPEQERHGKEEIQRPKQENEIRRT